MSLPMHDWQFWVVTALALAGAAYLLREVLPGRLWKRGRGKGASLTVEGRAPDRGHAKRAAKNAGATKGPDAGTTSGPASGPGPG